jgi:XRE family aerobic/anaerobic benzoate catabolism transcriptional regulator
MANGKAPADSGETDAAADAYLKALGARVRRIRAQRGMTRRILARDSAVSERYLAQLESGRGNVSILLLRQIAAAMGVPLADLVHEGPERAVEFALAQQLLAGLDAKGMAAAYQLLAQQFGREGGEERGGRIALIGLRGAGKTTLGRVAAERLGLPFVEMAHEIAAEAGTTLSEVFSLYGQAAYRRYERRALERVVASHPRAVIATGGSLVSEPATFATLLRACHTVWIKASPHEHMARVVAQGDMRPMKGSPEAMEDLKRILDGRHALYSKADAAIDTSGKSPAECAEALVRITRTLLGRAEAA